MLGEGLTGEPLESFGWEPQEVTPVRALEIMTQFPRRVNCGTFLVWGFISGKPSVK